MFYKIRINQLKNRCSDMTHHDDKDALAALLSYFRVRVVTRNRNNMAEPSVQNFLKVDTVETGKVLVCLLCCDGMVYRVPHCSICME